MSKTLRNSLFTVVAVSLTAVGVGWNRQVIKDKDPVAIGQTVLAEQPVESLAATGLPVSASYSRPNVKLGQSEELTVKTAPNADLEIVTIYPNGSVNNPQTLTATADEVGQYTLQFTPDDFHYLGIFQTVVVAKLGGETGQAKTTFTLQTWTQADQKPVDTTYVYPLVP